MDIKDPELTPSLLKFYRSRVHELQKERSCNALERLKHVELSCQERKRLERELLEYDDELCQTQQDLEDVRNMLIRERRAVIELVEENAQVRARCNEASIDSVPTSEQLSLLKRQYETLLTSLLTDHKSYLAKSRLQRNAIMAKMEDLHSRCARLETAVAEGTKELLKERTEKKVLEIRVEEMQTNIEQRILDLRSRLTSHHSDSPSDTTKLQRENEHLRTSLGELKGRLASQSSTSQERIARLELELHRRKQMEIELELHSNTAFRDRIKQLERLALRYAPLQDPDVDLLFSEIEHAKDIVDGTLPPPKYTKRQRRNTKLRIPQIAIA